MDIDPEVNITNPASYANTTMVPGPFRQGHYYQMRQRAIHVSGDNNVSDIVFFHFSSLLMYSFVCYVMERGTQIGTHFPTAPIAQSFTSFYLHKWDARSSRLERVTFLHSQLGTPRFYDQLILSSSYSGSGKKYCRIDQSGVLLFRRSRLELLS